MSRRLLVGILVVLVTALAVGAARAGVSFADPPGGWAYIYTGDQCVAQFDACLDGKWNHNDAAAGGSDAWDGSAPGQMGAAGAKPSPGGAGIFTDGDTSFLRIQDPGDPRSAPGGGWADPGNRKLTFTHNLTEVPNGTTILDDGVTLGFRARIPTTPPLDPLYPPMADPLPGSPPATISMTTATARSASSRAGPGWASSASPWRWMATRATSRATV